MKLYEVNHVTEKHNENQVMGLELRFTDNICCLTGKKVKPIRQPDEWDNVKRLTNNLFYAWDDKNPVEGSVFLGVFEANATKQTRVFP